MTLLDVKKAFALMKQKKGTKLNMWFCAGDENGKPVVLVAKEGKKVPKDDIKAILTKAKKKEACKGEVEITSDGSLSITPIGKKPGSLEKGVQIVARENQVMPKAIIVQKEREDDEDEDDKPLKSKTLGAEYKDEDKKVGWRADNVTTVPDGKGGRRPATPKDIEEIREKTTTTTKYYDEQEKTASAVAIDPKGKLRDAQGDKLADRKHGFVMDPDTRKVHTFEAKVETDAQGNRKTTHHSSPLAGKPVAGAGHIKTKKGRIVTIDDASGHYKPSAELTWQVVMELGRQGATLDETLVDVDGDPIDPKDWKAAHEKLSKARPLLEKYDKERKRLAGMLLKFGDKLSEKETEKIKSEIDKNTDNFEKLTDAIQDAAELIRGAGPANRPAKVELQGKEGLSQDEYDQTRGDVKKINALLRKKLKINRDILPDDLDSGTLNSRPALNLKIGELTKLKLTTQQFEQTHGNEKQARLKDALNKEITAKRDEEKRKKKQAKEEEWKQAREALQKRIKELGASDEEDALIKLGVPSNMAEFMPSDLRDAVIFGTMTGKYAAEEMDKRGW